MTPAIRVRNVAKSFRIPTDRAATLKYRVTHPRSSSKYRQFDALHDMSFDVADGEFLGIIGHNGCGKSTLLKILAGIYLPTSGSVEVSGRVSPFLELGVGFNPELTARENVFLSGSVLGLTRRELEGRVEAILSFAEIEAFAETKLKNFSSGMQVRLAFSVAIQADAEILLMDEVLAVGDAAFAEKCFDVFARYKEEGRTIVLVTHDLNSIQSYCDRALLLDHGRLILDGSVADVTGRYRRMVGAQSDHLNAQEGSPSADAPADTTADPGEGARWGSREVVITGVRLLNGEGEEHSTFTSGEPMVVEVAFLVLDEKGGPFICGLTFERVDGLSIALPNTLITGQVLPCPPVGTRGVIRYSIPAVPFLGAGYYLHAALYDEHASHARDHIQRMLRFRVSDERGRLGLVDAGGRWEFSVGESPLTADGGSLVRSQSG